ncbi:MAG: ATP-binding cassette domain-containing protein [Clostridium sp.]|nr:ATP-binding cassette domain-containing protein [Clostridium sp.]MCM1207281.1 ATP-binding cassette domain-containing protein [Ruminococcus sp.]
MFHIEEITKSYGKKLVLDNISLSIAENEAVGILGVNGSGKSTLLSCIAKKYADADSIKIGYMPQENPLFDELSAIDNIKMWTKLSKAEIAAALNTPPLSDMGISDFAGITVKKMSGGMKKRISLAIALINNPDILLLDEPFASLDLPAKEDILKIMKAFLDENKSIIVASHDNTVFDFCSKVYLLKDGTLMDANALISKGISYVDILRGGI